MGNKRNLNGTIDLVLCLFSEWSDTMLPTLSVFSEPVGFVKIENKKHAVLVSLLAYPFTLSKAYTNQIHAL